MSNNNIHIKVGADYTELTGLIKTTDQTKRSLDLVSKSFARTGDQKAWMSGVMQIVHAQEKLNKSTRMTHSEIMKLAHQYKQSAKFSNALAAATNKASNSASKMSRHMSRGGVAMQQFGYQAGDFIVQVQSGQNAMIAFGQQATQMVGALYMLPPATLAGSVGIMGLRLSVGLLIASLGIIVPLATAVGAAFMRAKGTSETLDQRVQKLAKSYSDLRESMDRIEDVKIDETFGNLTSEIHDISEAMADLNYVATLDNLMATFDKLGEP